MDPWSKLILGHFITFQSHFDTYFREKMTLFRDPCKKCLVKACCKYDISYNWCERKENYDLTQPDLEIAIILLITIIFFITVLIVKRI
jgi:hypothetical protein